MPPKRSTRKRKLEEPDEKEDDLPKSKRTAKSSATNDDASGKENSSKKSKPIDTKSAKKKNSANPSGNSEKPSSSTDFDTDAHPSSSKKSDVDVNANDKRVLSSRPFSHWLFKSEPESRMENGVDVKFGFGDLEMEPDRTACWDGVRNYQARNFMKDQMRVGDKAFFYHSNTKPPGIIGLIDVVKESYVDHTQFDRKDPHFDPKATKDNPKWFMVDVKYNRPLKRYISLYELKDIHLKHKAKGGPLKDLALFTKARLSVQPLTEEEFGFILGLENEDSN